MNVAVLSFDRPHYLARTLISLQCQMRAGDNIYLFQDGCYNPFSGVDRGNKSDVARSIAVFKAIFPKSICFQAHENIGIASNYRKAENFIFQELQSDIGLFLEDDMVLSPNYLDVIDQLLSFCDENEQIGYVSAYGDFWSSYDDQALSESRLRPMHENWGFALTRKSWQKQSAIREQYWNLVKYNDYRERDHHAIRKYYSSLGYNNPITSQDGARWVACAAEGLARITTATCHALYIGERGVHFSPEYYNAHAFGNAVMYPFCPTLDKPSEDLLRAWISAERLKMVQGYNHEYVAISGRSANIRGGSQDLGLDAHVTMINRDAARLLAARSRTPSPS